MEQAPRVSVVVITKNQRSFLMRSLPRIAAQTMDGVVETIVVDSGSTDGACDIVKQIPGVRLVEIAPATFNYARANNAGAKAARGDIVVRLSGDAVPVGNDWLKALTEPFGDPRVAATWGRQATPPNVYNPLEAWFGRWLHPDTNRARVYWRDVTVLGCNMAYRRDLWQQHPFDERLPQAEDYEWMHHWYKRGYMGVYQPQAVVCHGHNENFVQALRRSLAQSALQGLILANVYEHSSGCSGSVRAGAAELH